MANELEQSLDRQIDWLRRSAASIGQSAVTHDRRAWEELEAGSMDESAFHRQMSNLAYNMALAALNQASELLAPAPQNKP